MKRIIFFLVGLLAICSGCQVKAVSSADNALVDITLAEETPRAVQVKETLQSLLKQYDLTPYLFSHRVIIQPKAIPHSHPVLTLNTRHTEPAQILSNFLHEEIHWFLERNNRDTKLAIAELRTHFPQVPSGPPEGAKDEESTYLHLIVNYLELQADRKYLGKELADALIRNEDVYTWIYQQVLLNESVIREIVQQYKLEI